MGRGNPYGAVPRRRFEFGSMGASREELGRHECQRNQADRVLQRPQGTASKVHGGGRGVSERPLISAGREIYAGPPDGQAGARP